MKKNKNSLVGAISFMPFVNKRLLLLLFAKFTLFGVVVAQTPQIWPVEISFNYEGGSTNNDAVTIRKNASTIISIPEYVKDSRNESSAYIVSQNSRKVKVKFNSNNTNMNYLVKATVISGTGIGNVCEMFVAPCNINSTVFTIELSGSIPGSVGKNTFTWKWEATALPINSPYCPIICTSVNTTHTYYTMLATPQTPMNTPWTDVLDFACVWASGQLNTNGTVAKITEGAYVNLGMSHVYSYSSHVSGDGFDLSAFLIEDFADCKDMAAIVQVFSNALGIANITTLRIMGDFNYKPIIPIGNCANCWTTGTWKLHQVGYFGGKVYDACIKIKQSQPRIPIEENLDGNYKTDLYQSGDWSTYGTININYIR